MTRRKIWERMLAVTIAVGTLASTAAAQKKDPPSAETAKAVAKAPAAVPNDGIKVHGHWTIIIRNPDSSVASRREFENSLTQNGQQMLPLMLTGQDLQFNWIVAICGTGTTVVRPCNFAEAALANQPHIISQFGDNGSIPILSVSVPTTGANSGKLVLSGSATATVAGQITYVNTLRVVLTSNSLDYAPFTSTNLSQPIAVQAGQTVNVTVVISFS